jgi:hypothetical protein
MYGRDVARSIFIFLLFAHVLLKYFVFYSFFCLVCFFFVDILEQNVELDILFVQFCLFFVVF